MFKYLVLYSKGTKSGAKSKVESEQKFEDASVYYLNVNRRPFSDIAGRKFDYVLVLDEGVERGEVVKAKSHLAQPTSICFHTLFKNKVSVEVVESVQGYPFYQQCRGDMSLLGC